MKLIIGLGNPGKKYQNNRHNVGFMAVDAITSQISNFKFPISNEIPNSKFKNNKKLQSLITIHKSLILAKPQTYMNSSGIAVSKIVNQFKIKKPDIWVIHDDLDLLLGQFKIQFGIGPKVHNGLLSIYEKLGTKDFWHVRIGVDNRLSKFSIFNFQFSKRIPGEKYVLQNFTIEEQKILDETIAGVETELINRVIKL